MAVAAEALYLANLLLAPGLAFLALLWLWRREGGGQNALAHCHLCQAVGVSLWGGLLIALAVAILLASGGWGQAWAWMAVLLYFTCIHSLLVLLGMFGLAKAMAGKIWFYPLVGRACVLAP